ncbi:hypothetical protein CJ178_30140 [Rhodococcus sp. ACPA4]|nr:hypothetical protein CJ178_30140 [Rhodococcus sp. ACPA4]
MVEHVTDESGTTEVWHHQFMQTEFAKLIPRELWSLGQLPELEKDTVNMNDTLASAPPTQPLHYATT